MTPSFSLSLSLALVSHYSRSSLWLLIPLPFWLPRPPFDVWFFRSLYLWLFLFYSPFPAAFITACLTTVSLTLSSSPLSLSLHTLPVCNPPVSLLIPAQSSGSMFPRELRFRPLVKLPGFEVRILSPTPPPLSLSLACFLPYFRARVSPLPPFGFLES